MDYSLSLLIEVISSFTLSTNKEGSLWGRPNKRWRKKWATNCSRWLCRVIRSIFRRLLLLSIDSMPSKCTAPTYTSSNFKNTLKSSFCSNCPQKSRLSLPVPEFMSWKMQARAWKRVNYTFITDLASSRKW